MAINRYFATSLTGGAAGSLDSIDPTDTDGSSTALAVGDICDVIEDGKQPVTYIAKSASGMVEKPPEIIIPNTNAGNWYWELQPTTNGAVMALVYSNMPGGF